jgi:DNA-binding SARP family transcriptional activator
MNDLYQLLFDKGQVGKVLEILRRPGLPDPASDPDRALLYAHALRLYGDAQQAVKVYSAISPNPSRDAERLWGLAHALLALGDSKQIESLLDEALQFNPPPWLRARICNTAVNLYIFKGQFEKAFEAIEQGIEAAQRGNNLIEQFILEGNRGVIKIYQGAFEEAVLLLQKTVQQLQVRDCILPAANFLINLGTAWDALGDPAKAGKSLSRAEELLHESGSKARLIYLKIVAGSFAVRQGLLEKGARTYAEALELLREVSSPTLEAMLFCNLADIYFKKGDPSAALSLAQKALTQVREKGLRSQEAMCLGYQGKFLLHAGAAGEGIASLTQACTLAESLGMWGIFSNFALYLSQGLEESNQKVQALEWLGKCFEATERNRLLPALLEERELLTSLLLKRGAELPLTDFLSRMIIQLHHPALCKHLLGHNPPEGKVLFLRSLKVHEARRFRPQLGRLRNDPAKEVRRASRLILNGWHHHAGYRVYTFGTLQVFLEGKVLADKDWIRPGVKRLFLYLATRPEKWQSTDSLLEALWRRSQPKNARKALSNLFSRLREAFEPWHLPDMDYVFFKSQRGANGFFPGDRFWIDYQEFEEGIKRAEKAHRDRNFKEARKDYREALDLYLGDYLEEFPYEDFIRPKRDYLRELYFRSALRYATLERDSGNLPEARRVLEEALFKDISRCECTALLIKILDQMKLSQRAKDWGDRHLKYIRKELREKPSLEVVEALKQIK